jgi:predicted acyltransferase
MAVKEVYRVHSIDVFRAVVMFLMIFVNDLEGVPGVPIWLKHAGERVDGLGLADTIFPAFLFIVGLSIPFSLRVRSSQGNDRYRLMIHIISRSFALIFIGFIHANMETYSTAAVLPQTVWEILITISFFLVWIAYPESLSKKTGQVLKWIGVIMLVILCLLYKGGPPNAPPVWLHFSWWGILGLIGWAYLVCALIYLFAGKNLWVLIPAWVFFLLFNLDYHFGWLNFLNGVQGYVGLAGNGAMQAFTMSGVIISLIYSNFARAGKTPLLWVVFILLSVIMFNIGFIVRYFSGGISKANDTPSWVMICTGINIIAYGLFMFIVDFWEKQNWLGLIKPAGTNTLTCYLLPFLFYPLYEMSEISYPDVLTHGTGGLIKCIVFALLMVWLTGLLERRHIRLKI